jgi:hypothetical protein
MKRLCLLSLLGAAALAQNTAIFPGAVPTPARIGVAANACQTTLALGILATDTSIPVMSSSCFKAAGFLTVDNEIMAVCAIPDGTHVTVGVSACPNVDGRGTDVANGGGAAAGHLANAAVQARIVAWQLNQGLAETIAVETKLHSEMASVADKGAKCDGSTDDSAAFTAALAASSYVIVPWSAAGCKVASGVTLAGNQTLEFNGTALLLSANNEIGVTMAGSSATLRNAAIRLSGSPTGTTGILIGNPAAATQHNTLFNVTIDGPANGLVFHGYANQFNYYNNTEFLSVSHATTGILFTADSALWQPDRQKMVGTDCLTVTTCVDIAYGATEEFDLLNVEGATTGVLIENVPASPAGNSSNAIYGYEGESVSGCDLDLAGPEVLFNTFSIVGVANAGQICDNSASNTNAIYQGLTPNDRLGGFLGTLGGTALGTTYAWQWSGNASFANGTANQVAYVDFGTQAIDGALDVTVTGSYSDADATGVVKKSIQMVRDAGSGISDYYSQIVAAAGPAATQFAIGDFIVDGSDHLKLPIYLITSLGNSATVSISGSFLPLTVAPYIPVNPAMVAPAVVSNTQGQQIAGIDGLLPNGAFKLQPACTAAFEGYPWYVNGGSTYNGTFEICQNQSGTYAYALPNSISNSVNWNGAIAFTNATANQVAYLDLGNINLATAALTVSLTGTYTYSDGIGNLTKSIDLVRLLNASIAQQFTQIVQATGLTGTQFAIGDAFLDGSNHLKIPIYNLTSGGGTAYVSVTGLSSAFPLSIALIAPAVVSNSQGVQGVQYLLPGTVGQAQPTCALALEGTPWYTKGSGVANGVFQICQNQSGTYSWVTH